MSLTEVAKVDTEYVQFVDPPEKKKLGFFGRWKAARKEKKEREEQSKLQRASVLPHESPVMDESRSEGGVSKRFSVHSVERDISVHGARRLTSSLSSSSSDESDSTDRPPSSLNLSNAVSFETWGDNQGDIPMLEGAMVNSASKLPHTAATGSKGKKGDDKDKDADFLMPDKSARNCHGCDLIFTAFVRKHHCRLCGYVFCKNCTSHHIPGDYVGSNKPLRACDSCFRIANEDRLLMSGPGRVMQLKRAASQRQGNAVTHFEHASRHGTATTMGASTSPGGGSGGAVGGTETPYFSTRGLHSGLDQEEALFAGMAEGAVLTVDAKSRIISPHGKGGEDGGVGGADSTDDEDDAAEADHLPLPPSNDTETASIVSSSSAMETSSLSSSATWTWNEEAWNNPKLSVVHGRANTLKDKGGVAVIREGRRSEAFVVTPEQCVPQVVGFELPSAPYPHLGGSRGEEGLVDDAAPLPEPAAERIFPANGVLAEDVYAQKWDLLMSQVLEAHQLSPGHWQKTLHALATEASAKVSPAVSAGDHHDIREFIKVKTICGGQPADSELIGGVAFSGSLLDARMRQRIVSPRILLFGGSFDYSGLTKKYVSLDKVVRQEEEHYAMHLARLVQFKPDIILFEGRISVQAKKLLLGQGIAAIQHVKTSLLQRLHRSCGGTVQRSVDHLVVGRPKVGTCQLMQMRSFSGQEVLPTDQQAIFPLPVVYSVDAEGEYIWNRQPPSVNELVVGGAAARQPPSQEATQALQLAALAKSLQCKVEPARVTKDICRRRIRSYWRKSKATRLSTPRFPEDVKSLVFFEGCPIKLGCTIVLRGADKDELRRVKRALRFLVYAKYHLMLELNMMHTHGACFVRPLEQEPLALSRISISPALRFDIPTGCVLQSPTDGTDTLTLPENSPEAVCVVKLEEQTLYQHQDIVVLYWRNCYATTTQCVSPTLRRLHFYRGADVSLGAFLTMECFDLTASCENSVCDKSMLWHTINFSHGNSNITIAVRSYNLEEKPFLKAPPGSDSNILCWYSCQLCRTQSSIKVMSEEYSNMSFGKFLEMMFCQHNAQAACGHAVFKDHVLYYARDGVVCQVKYNAIVEKKISLIASKLSINTTIVREIYMQELESITLAAGNMFTTFLTTLEMMKGEATQPEMMEILVRLEKNISEEKSLYFGQLGQLGNKCSVFSLNGLLRIIYTNAMSWETTFVDLSRALNRQRIYSLNLMANSHSAGAHTMRRASEKNGTVMPGRTVSANTHQRSSQGIRPQSQLQLGSSPTSSGALQLEGNDAAMESGINLSADAIVLGKLVYGSDERILADFSRDMEGFWGSLAFWGSGTATVTPHDQLCALMELGSSPIVDGSGSAKFLQHLLSESEDQVPGLEPMLSSNDDHDEQEEELPSHNNSSSSSNSNSNHSQNHSGRHSRKSSSSSSNQWQRHDLEEVPNAGKRNVVEVVQHPATLNKLEASPAHAAGPEPPTHVTKEREKERTPGIRAVLNKSIFRKSNPSSLTTQVVLDSPLETLRANLFDMSNPHMYLPPGIGNRTVVVFDDNPGSLIAYSLNSTFYRKSFEQIPVIKTIVQEVKEGLTDPATSDGYLYEMLQSPEPCHIKHKFTDEFSADRMAFKCVSYYPAQFNALRALYIPLVPDLSEQSGVKRKGSLGWEDFDLLFVQSLSRCTPWATTGGRSGSSFLKTVDERFILKNVKKTELESFLSLAPHYFDYMSKALHKKLPTVLVKILGVFSVSCKSKTKAGFSMSEDYVVMENLFYDRRVSKIYDLKGSLRNRYADPKKGDVLLDGNLLEAVFENPIFVPAIYKIKLGWSLFNDSLFLAGLNVMDYSLLVGVDADNNDLVVGIVDYIRQYTWDKHLETWLKASFGPQETNPTIISPKLYKERFRKAMDRYFVLLPSRFTAAMEGPFPMPDYIQAELVAVAPSDVGTMLKEMVPLAQSMIGDSPIEAEQKTEADIETEEEEETESNHAAPSAALSIEQPLEEAMASTVCP
jgi:hypothetical protein